MRYLCNLSVYITVEAATLIGLTFVAATSYLYHSVMARKKKTGAAKPPQSTGSTPAAPTAAAASKGADAKGFAQAKPAAGAAPVMKQADSRPENSPYGSPSCTIPFASPLTVPLEILKKSPKLHAAYELRLPELPAIPEGVGHVLVHYLHTGTYESLKPKPTDAMSKQICELKTSIQTYAAARTYDLPELMRLAEAKIEKYGKGLPLPALLEVARDAYPNLTEGDAWFLNYLRSRIRPHLKDPKSLMGSNLLDQISGILSPNRVLLRTVLELFCERIVVRPEATTPPAASTIASPVTSPGTSRPVSPHPPASSMSLLEMRSRSVVREEYTPARKPQKATPWPSPDNMSEASWARSMSPDPVLPETVPPKFEANPVADAKPPVTPFLELGPVIRDAVPSPGPSIKSKAEEGEPEPQPAPESEVKGAIEPKAKATEPKVEDAEQEVKSVEPEVKAAEPEVKAAEPEVKAAEPEVKAAEPEIKAAEPEIKAAEPEVKPAEPEVEATEPEAKPVPEPEVSIAIEPEPKAELEVELPAEPKAEPSIVPPVDALPKRAVEVPTEGPVETEATTAVEPEAKKVEDISEPAASIAQRERKDSGKGIDLEPLPKELDSSPEHVSELEPDSKRQPHIRPQVLREADSGFWEGPDVEPGKEPAPSIVELEESVAEPAPKVAHELEAIAGPKDGPGVEIRDFANADATVESESDKRAETETDATKEAVLDSQPTQVNSEAVANILPKELESQPEPEPLPTRSTEAAPEQSADAATLVSEIGSAREVPETAERKEVKAQPETEKVEPVPRGPEQESLLTIRQVQKETVELQEVAKSEPEPEPQTDSSEPVHLPDVAESAGSVETKAAQPGVESEPEPSGKPEVQDANSDSAVHAPSGDAGAVEPAVTLGAKPATEQEGAKTEADGAGSQPCSAQVRQRSWKRRFLSLRYPVLFGRGM
ncbi:hypothetical protein MYCTH_2299996 [Thermothelomyces thermophilus ATCC 42464]|uniref:Uncharacterized protein n=1 Tax=Thermothelomyces thermophilus (strain ATCC 42464 / BCRC 31852 / DSM 1799) TaxID=573729 RepID=G2QA54_THET4|nr:uncharacterized protein MYCTH_2299996 [Thermothelomyces thermophilus ATCC 42464]AEO55802.1 hypothetical protein MYCTH_2299996 [Thermothelomyces thermophilus ATCC 42464]